MNNVDAAQALDELGELIRAAKKANEAREDYPLFSQIISLAMKALRMDERDLAEELQVSPRSIQRYLEGLNAPHPAMRRVMYDHLDNLRRNMKTV